MSAPPSSRWVAYEWRSVCGDTPYAPSIGSPARTAVRRRIATDSLLGVVVGTASLVADPVREAFPGLTGSTVVPFDQE